MAPVVEMPVYLRWLVGRVEALGGTLTRMALTALPDQAEVVVNATGLGARRMADDTSVVPVRGQVVYVEQVGLDRWWLDGAGPTYVVPRSRDIVVGGTDDEGEWDRRPDPEVAKRILEPGRRAGARARPGAGCCGHRVGPAAGASRGAAGGGGTATAAGWCTATATAAPGSRCPGAAPTRSAGCVGLTSRGQATGATGLDRAGAHAATASRSTGP